MCGIAGAIDLNGPRLLSEGALRAMADAIVHRGPDEDGYFRRDGVAMANRRLSIVGLFDGRQPISNEDGTVSVVFNGELFDYPERRAELEARLGPERQVMRGLITRAQQDPPSIVFPEGDDPRILRARGLSDHHENRCWRIPHRAPKAFQCCVGSSPGLGPNHGDRIVHNRFMDRLEIITLSRHQSARLRFLGGEFVPGNVAH